MTEDFIFRNTFKSIRQFLQVFDEQETKPELEAYDAGMINNIAFMMSRGHVRKPLFLQFPMCTQSLLMGGNARVGLEDNLYIAKGTLAKRNAEQVEKVVRIAQELGIEPAPPDEAREILDLKGMENVNF
jgi:uncharacterized protein (DUF849 family)